MNFKKTGKVSLEQEGLRLDSFIAGCFKISRSSAEKAITNGLVTKVRGPTASTVQKPSQKVKAGEVYCIHQLLKPLNTSKELKPYSLAVPILFEDEHLLVIDKPAGLVVHPGPGHEQDTLVNALIHKTTLSSGSDPLRPGIVHRLDKDVSGLMILSKTKAVEKLLIEQFKNQKIQKIYRAITVGKAKNNLSPIVSFIGRHPKDRKKFYSYTTIDKGKKAITHYKIKKSFKEIIHYVECRLETGRTHQIRLHLKSRGLPILGDTVYFSARQQTKALKPLGLKAQVLAFKRLALYSAKLQFLHPVSQKNLQFYLPWPEEFYTLLKTLNF